MKLIDIKLSVKFYNIILIKFLYMESIEVAVRLRPLNEEEISKNES